MRITLLLLLIFLFAGPTCLGKTAALMQTEGTENPLEAKSKLGVNRQPFFRGIAWGDSEEIIRAVLPKIYFAKKTDEKTKITTLLGKTKLDLEKPSALTKSLDCLIELKLSEDRLFRVVLVRGVRQKHFKSNEWAVEFLNWMRLKNQLNLKYGASKDEGNEIDGILSRRLNNWKLDGFSVRLDGIFWQRFVEGDKTDSEYKITYQSKKGDENARK